MSKKAIAAAGCSCELGGGLGVLQDFTTYTEWEQTGNPLTVTAPWIKATNMANNKKDYVSKAIAGIGTGDFTCHTSVYVSGGGANPSYALVGASDTWVFPLSSNFLGVRLNETSTYKRLQLVEKHGLIHNWGGYLTIPATTWAYFRIRVVRAVGVHGTMYLQLFTDETYTTPSGSEISLALAATNAMTYWHGLSNGYTALARLWNGYIKDTYLIYGA